VREEISKLKTKLGELIASYRVENLKAEIRKCDEEAAKPDFWNDTRRAAKVQAQRSRNLGIVSQLEQVASDLNDAEEFAPIAEQGDADIARELEEKIDRSSKALEDLEFRRMLGGELDSSHGILTINSGAGGTESQDWVNMLFRMYLRWAERRGFKTNIIDVLPGEEAGLKNVTFIVEGPYAYGYLRSEVGIHRLVRISPFDSNKRRHTSFASVMVMPDLDDDIEVEIKEEDLRVDTYRSGGAGGQHVNKTDSAVRLTHIPTGIVVACQNERSQHKNRAQAMKVLRSRLYERQVEERDAERAKMAGEKKEIGFGSQIRSYVLQPYQLIKDHRTDYEMGNVQAVLDGDLDGFIRSFLLKKASDQ